MKSNYIPNIPTPEKKRVVIAGGGFAGLKLARSILGKGFQIILLDKNNFHQFQPLLYQVATAGLEPTSISFPVRKIFQNKDDIHFRMANITEVDTSSKEIVTDIGRLKYDFLVLAIGAETNFYGQEKIKKNAMSMKTASDAILIRNVILEHFEQALLETEPEKIEEYLNIVLVGGGPTGVELAGALSEMRKYIFPKDYPELDLSKMRIVLFEASPKLLSGMSETASARALDYLKKLGVEVHLGTRVMDYDGSRLSVPDDTTIRSKTVIWAAGVRANHINGLPEHTYSRDGRIKVDHYNRVQGFTDVFAIGDACLMQSDKYPNGHPQIAQPAIQHAKKLSKNLININKGKELIKFEYNDKGSMATIGRHLAVADLPFIKLKGYLAWLLWTFVHLFTIFGVKNRILTFLNWSWNYFTYDQSLRVLIKPLHHENMRKGDRGYDD